jgi:hypothetical protein
LFFAHALSNFNLVVRIVRERERGSRLRDVGVQRLRERERERFSIERCWSTKAERERERERGSRLRDVGVQRLRERERERERERVCVCVCVVSVWGDYGVAEVGCDWRGVGIPWRCGDETRGAECCRWGGCGEFQ